MVRGKYVQRYDIKSTDGYILRNRIEAWLESFFKELETCDLDFLHGLDNDIFVVVEFLHDIQLINDNVREKYLGYCEKIMKEREEK